VLEESDDFLEINDLLKRHETLKAHHKDLQARAAEVVGLNDHYRMELQQYTKDGQDAKLRDHNEIARLQKELERYELESLVAGGSRERMLEDSAERVLEFGKCGMAITNLYERCRAKSKVRVGTAEMRATRTVRTCIRVVCCAMCSWCRFQVFLLYHLL
jgi:hypothetical protein